MIMFNWLASVALPNSAMLQTTTLITKNQFIVVTDVLGLIFKLIV